MKEGYEYKSKLLSIDDGIMTFANGHTFPENTDSVFYEYRAVVVEEYVNRYNSAKNSKECQIRTVTPEFIDAVSAIIENPDAIRRMCEIDDIFDRVYRHHYILGKKMFEDKSWTLFTSMCQSLLM